MSGVFAILDPAGVDQDVVLRAMSNADFRGAPDVRSAGTVAVGTYVDEGAGGSDVRRHDDHLVALDAAVAGPVPGTTASSRARGLLGPDFLDDVFSHLGPTELIGVAGDYVIASAEPQRGRIVVARDAFGSRPLFHASRDGVHAFASDVEVLLALGLATGRLDEEVISAFLSFDSLGDEGAARTAFAGVRSVLAGHWIEVMPGRPPLERRWFVPSRLEPPALDKRSGVRAVRDVLIEATAARAVGGRVGLQLSGGRDSGAVAVALRDAGVSALCLTYEFDPAVQRSETEQARSLATQLHHDWVPVRCDAPRREELDCVQWGAGTPLVASSWSLYLRTMRLAKELGVATLLTGDGGEPLFQASPRSVVDLLYRGRLLEALQASRNFHRSWTYPYRIQGKGAIRLFLPARLLEVRERARPIPPWVVDRFSSRREPPRESWSEQRRLVRAVTAPEAYSHDYGERLARRHGMNRGSPMLDLRVLRIALGLPLELRAPVSAPKPALREALLRTHAEDRVKMSLEPYFRHVALTLQSQDPDLFARDSMAVQAGLVRAEGLDAVDDPRWLLQSSNLAVFESWLHKGLHWTT